jgi:hypothetical protein
MEQFEFVNKLNIKRLQNLLETSLNESERRTIQKLLTEEKAKQGLSTSTEVGIDGPLSDVTTVRAASKSRVLGLDGADWSMLLAGVALCGLMVLFIV